MAGNRTLKLSILADTADLVKGLKTAENETQSSSGRIGNAFAAVGKAAAVAGAAVAAYGVKLAVDGVKAAIEDEQAQVKLAGSLQRVTKATDDQIAAVEKQITVTALATGVADDELRPALDRLTRSTKNIEQSQKLLNLALDISRGSGKSLESVTNALSKSFEGQNTALGKLGVGISAAQLKTMDFDDITKQLANTFEGAAADAAETFSGKTARLQVAFDEAKESVGAALLPILTRLFDFINEFLVPIFDRFQNDTSGLAKTIKDFLTPVLNTLRSAYEKISTAVKENADEYRPLIDLLKSLANFVKGTVAPILVDVLGAAFRGIVNTVTFLIDKIGDLIQLFARLGTAIKNSPLGKLGAGIADLFSGGSKAGLSINTLEGGSARGGLISQSFTDQLAESLAAPVAGVLSPITEEFKRNVIGLVPGNPNGVNNAWIESLKDSVGFLMGREGGFGLYNAQGQLTGGNNPGNIRNIPGSVTINVNAPSVIDEEGFARAVGQALSNSSARAGTVEITPQFSAV
jgi:hypothetical protein